MCKKCATWFGMFVYFWSNVYFVLQKIFIFIFLVNFLSKVTVVLPTQRTRVRRFYAKQNCLIVQNLFSKKAYIRRNIDVKTTKCRDFARISTLFQSNSYNRRNISVKPSQRRYITAILREKKICVKKAQALAYTAVYGDFAPKLYFFRAKTSLLFVGKFDYKCDFLMDGEHQV